MEKNSLAEAKYKLLQTLDKTGNLWKSKKSLTVATLVKSSKKAIKIDDITSINTLNSQLQQENKKELQRRTQIKEEKAKLLHDIDLADSMDTKTKSFKFVATLKRAKALSQKQKVELDELTEVEVQLNECLKAANDQAEKDKQEALAQADEKALLEEEVRDNPRNEITSSLAKLASFPPDKSGENPYRPDWIHYDNKQQVWKVNPNDLANDIVKKYKIKRMEEKGNLIGYISYHTESGLWEAMVPEGLGNYVDNYFEAPDKYTDSLSKQYAEDLHTAKAVKDTLVLLKSKIGKIVPNETFDRPDKYLVHFKDVDLNVYTFKYISHDSKHYFLNGVNFNLDSDSFLRLRKNFFTKDDDNKENDNKDRSFEDVRNDPKITVSPERIIRSIAPITCKWILESLGGDKKTLIAFLERLGLSMLHDYTDNFVVFLHGDANTGKSKLFNLLSSLFDPSSVSALDLDSIAKTNSFDAKELRYKTINLTSESKATFLDETALNIIEQLSGGDLRNYSQKFKDTADFINFSHLWLNFNDLPQLAQFDNAIARRADVFHWQSIPNFEEKYDWDLIMKERPQLIVKSLYYAHLLLTQNTYQHYDYCNSDLRLTRSEDMIKWYRDWADDKDYFQNFIKTNCKLNAVYKMGCKELLKSYNQFLANEKMRGITQNQLTNLLLKKGIKKVASQNWKDAKNEWHRNVYVYEGIATNEVAGIQNEMISFEQQQYNAGKQRSKKIFD